MVVVVVAVEAEDGYKGDCKDDDEEEEEWEI